jgi:hypothetical protein
VETNALYYGDNLSILRNFIPDARERLGEGAGRKIGPASRREHLILEVDGGRLRRLARPSFKGADAGNPRGSAAAVRRNGSAPHFRPVT